MPRRLAVPFIGLALAVLLLAGPLALLRGGMPAASGGPDVVFVVLDTVRSDHTSLCGYARPTTPFLEELVAGGAVHTCDAIAPGTWTMPTHASYFTGLDAVEHGAHALLSGIDTLAGASIRARPLRANIPTLAERFAERGYRTVAFTANPVVNEQLGLTRGFEVVRAAERWGQLHGDRYRGALEDTLAQQVPGDGRPLFLFVNVADAHQPWAAVPAGRVDWLDKPWKYLHYGKDREDDPWRRYVEGRMDPQQEAELRQRVRDQYDWAVATADANLRATFEALDQHGICRRRCRIVVTSDHGELLGEHQLLDHGHYVWDGVVRVPVLVRDAGFRGPLPEPMNGRDLFGLLLDGALPDAPSPVLSHAWPHARRCARTGARAFCDSWVGLWEGGSKYVWKDGESYAVEADGAETLTPLEEGPVRRRLEAEGARVDADARDDGKQDEGVMEVLRAFGYVE